MYFTIWVWLGHDYKSVITATPRVVSCAWNRISIGRWRLILIECAKKPTIVDRSSSALMCVNWMRTFEEWKTATEKTKKKKISRHGARCSCRLVSPRTESGDVDNGRAGAAVIYLLITAAGAWKPRGRRREQSESNGVLGLPKRRLVARRDARTATRGAGHRPRLSGLVAHGRQAVRVLVHFERVFDVAQRPGGRRLRHAHPARHVHPRVGILLFVRLQREHGQATRIPQRLERDFL